jgi:hypothetical protein
MEEPVQMPEADEFNHESYHRFLSAHVCMNVAGEVKHGRVVKRKRDEDGILIGVAHKNPLLDTSLYEVEFTDSMTEAYSANIIAENIWAKTNDKGNLYSLKIVVHERSNDALHKDDQYIIYNGQQCLRRTTKGCKLYVRYVEGHYNLVDWLKRSQGKSNPVEVAEYAVENKLVSEPAFKWWVPYTLKKKEQIISKIKTCYLQYDQSLGSR